MCLRKDVTCRTFRVAIFIRVVEQPQFVFRYQDAAAGGVQCFHRNLAFLNGFFQSTYKTLAYHIHIHSGVDGTCRYRLEVADTVVYHFGNTGIVGDYKSVESPLTAQDVRH